MRKGEIMVCEKINYTTGETIASSPSEITEESAAEENLLKEKHKTKTKIIGKRNPQAPYQTVSLSMRCTWKKSKFKIAE